MAEPTPIKQRRLEKGMTLEQVAAVVGITKGELSAYELQRRRIPADRLHRIFEALDMTVEAAAVAPYGGPKP